MIKQTEVAGVAVAGLFYLQDQLPRHSRYGARIRASMQRAAVGSAGRLGKRRDVIIAWFGVGHTERENLHPGRPLNCRQNQSSVNLQP